MADERVVRGAVATLTVELADGNGDPVTVDGVTVEVVRDADATVFVASTAATDLHGGVWGVDLPAQTVLGALTATWTVGDSTMTTTAEIVGARLFTPAELRRSDPSLADATKVTAADIADVTAEVEDEFARICGVSFIPRGAVEVLSPRPWWYETPFRHLLVHPKVNVDTVAAVVDNTDIPVEVTPAGEVTVPWPWQQRRHPVHVAYEHGWPTVPADVRRAALLRARHRVNSVRSGVPDRATSFASSDGGTFTLTTAGRGGSETGIPDVDAVLRRYDMRTAS
jgi:hypothetical protein